MAEETKPDKMGSEKAADFQAGESNPALSLVGIIGHDNVTAVYDAASRMVNAIGSRAQELLPAMEWRPDKPGSANPESRDHREPGTAVQKALEIESDLASSQFSRSLFAQLARSQTHRLLMSGYGMQFSNPEDMRANEKAMDEQERSTLGLPADASRADVLEAKASIQAIQECKALNLTVTASDSVVLAKRAESNAIRELKSRQLPADVSYANFLKALAPETTEKNLQTLHLPANASYSSFLSAINKNRALSTCSRLGLPENASYADVLKAVGEGKQNRQNELAVDLSRTHAQLAANEVCKTLGVAETTPYSEVLQKLGQKAAIDITRSLGLASDAPYSAVVSELQSVKASMTCRELGLPPGSTYVRVEKAQAHRDASCRYEGKLSGSSPYVEVERAIARSRAEYMNKLSSPGPNLKHLFKAPERARK